MGKYSRLGIGIVVAVWLLILLVPSLNAYFRLQVRNESGTGAIPVTMPSPKHTPNFWEKAARRLPGERAVLYRAALERPIRETERAGYALLGDLLDNLSDEPTPFDANLPASTVFPGRMAKNARDERIRRIGLLCQKYPDDAFLIATAIKLRLATFQSERLAGELSDPRRREKGFVRHASPERRKEKTNFTPADFERVIALCRLGQKLKPDNGYFNWMESLFLFHSWRDEEALKALETVGRKSRYDDYSGAEKLAEVNALSLAWGRPLLYEEKAGVLSWNELAQYSRHRELARIISWEAIKAQRRGDRAQAVRIVTALARASGRWRDHSSDDISASTAILIEKMGWHGLTYDVPGSWPQPMRSEELQKKQHKIWRAYFAEHGLQALAMEWEKNHTINEKFRLQLLQNFDHGWFGPSYSAILSMGLLWIGGVGLLLLLILPLLTSILLALGKRMGLIRRWLRWEESDVDEVPLAREVWQGVLACAGLRAWATGLCAFLLISPVLIIFSGGLAAFLQRLHEQSIFRLLLEDGTAVWSVDSWARFYLHLIGSMQQDAGRRLIVLCTPILFATLYAAWRAVEWQKHKNNEPIDSKSLLPGKALDFVIMSLLIGSFFGPLFSPYVYTARGINLSLVLATFVCAAVLLGEKYFAWRKRPHRRAAVRYSLRLLQRSLFCWLVVGSVLYLGTLILSLPLQSRAAARVDRVMEIGEMQARQEWN